ncbi:RhoGAP [Nesidiocoris tenuis]|uniref:RhoGAP n=1 Tax=Nesidiocoris tenuis TaxID=355587 RepID=A0ABN7AGU9_9HEMI|nr:RhoGAP [Nesidiocoris tenuis]
MVLKPLEFTECITDSPFFREKLHAHEKELEGTSQQMKRLIKELKDLLTAAQNLSRAQRTLSNTLKNFKFELIGDSRTEDESVISQSFAEFGKLIDAIEDERLRMMARTHDQIIVPLETFRKERIGGVKEGKKRFEKQTAKFCQSQERYLNLSTKKQDAILQEADATLEMEQRHFCQASLQYVFLLQEVQEQKKFEFVEILLTLMLGWLTFYHQGYETAEESRPYLNELQFRIQRTRENFTATRDKTEQLMKKTLEMRLGKQLETGSSSKATKEGYLFLMEKKAFGMTWTKHYCSYKKDTKEFSMTPYNQMTGKFSTPDVMVLESCVRRMSESIEKRFCFDLTSIDRPGIVYTLQALSEDDRKQWMDAMDGREPMYGTPAIVKPLKPEECTSLDDTGFFFVTKCISTIESRGLDEQGLYRVVGVASKTTKLLALGMDKKRFEKDDLSEWETKVITSSLKAYFRFLVEPLMTFRLHNDFIAAAKLDYLDERVKRISELVHCLPPLHYNMLKILIEHLHNVASNADKNLMPVSNLGVCFGPTLLRPEVETVAAIIDIKFYNIVVEILIEKCHQIFVPQFKNEADITPEPTAVPRPSVPAAPISTNHRKVDHSQLTGKTNFDGATALSTSLHNVTIPNAHPKVPPSAFHRGGRVANAVAAFSEGNLLSISSTSQQHPLYASPPNLKLLHKSNLVNSDLVNSTSSSNESVSSMSSRDISSSHTFGTPRKRNTSHNNDASPNYVRIYRNGKVRTLYACLGEHDGELSFEPNQIITNVKCTLEPGWLEGTLNGKTGLVPENYVEPLP